MLTGYKRFFRVFVPALAVAVFICGAAFAAEGDRQVGLTFTDSGGVVSLGSGFIRGGDIWVPADSVRRMGVSLRDAPNGKGFTVDIQNPAQVFGIDDLALLAGNSMQLYFPSLVEDNVRYFNMTGMERVTSITLSQNNGTVAFSKMNAGDMLPVKPEKPSGETKGKISLVWAHITKDNPPIENEQRITGLDIISPTWFNLMDGSGGMANRASAAYVDAAHRKGYKIWALVSNGFSKTLTAQLFKNPRGVNMFIARILAYAKLYDLDGINIDFENVDANDRNSFVRFMALLAPKLRAQGLILSVDVHVPGNSGLSRSHDRGALAQYADYVMLMAYDQHWRTSPRSGSVASMPWVERAVQNTLAEGVPPQKLVLGVPFYMRRWQETPAGGGKVAVKSYTLTMAESDALIAKKGLSPVWKEDLGQHYYSYIENGKTYKVWVENEKSMAYKLQLVAKYGLAGAAGWRKGHEKQEIWGVFSDVLMR